MCCTSWRGGWCPHLSDLEQDCVLLLWFSCAKAVVSSRNCPWVQWLWWSEPWWFKWQFQFPFLHIRQTHHSFMSLPFISWGEGGFFVCVCVSFHVLIIWDYQPNSWISGLENVIFLCMKLLLLESVSSQIVSPQIRLFWSDPSPSGCWAIDDSLDLVSVFALKLPVVTFCYVI